jgi:hypothetical protein
MIWGYEEPENNLEMLAAFNLAKDFIDYSKEIQILLTTHSPGFYNLKENNNEIVNLFKVTKEKNKDAEIIELDNYNDLDTDMGVMPLIAPYVNEKVIEIEKLQKEITNYEEELLKININTIFVEGDDEVRIFTEILKFLKVEKKIKISKEGLGCSGVKNQLMAWSWISGITEYKAAGVFDNDTSGISQYNKLKEEKQFIEAETKHKVKALHYKVPSHLINIKSKINNFPIELEEMYPIEVWKMANLKGWLEQREIPELTTFVTVDNLFQNITEKINTLGFSSDEQLYVLYKVPDKHKNKLSKILVVEKKLHFNIKFEHLIKIFKDTLIPFLTK